MTTKVVRLDTRLLGKLARLARVMLSLLMLTMRLVALSMLEVKFFASSVVLSIPTRPSGTTNCSVKQVSSSANLRRE